MANETDPTTGPDEAIFYQVRIRGQLDAQWQAWFEGLSITPQENGDTLLSGAVRDQAALFGLLKKVRDLGLPLLSVNCIEPGQLNAPGVKKSLEAGPSFDRVQRKRKE